MKLGYLSDQQFAYLVIIPVIAFCLALTFYPIFHSFYLSLSLEETLGFENYAVALQDPDVLYSISASFYFSLITIIMCVFLGLGIALILNEALPGRGVLRVIALMPWVVSEFVGGLTWRFIFSQTYGVINGLLYTLGIISKYQNWMTETSAMFLVAIAYSWHFAPLGAFFLLAALQTVPEDLYKSAKIDGAGFISRFRHVTLPFIRYALLIVLVLTTMFTMTAFDTFYIMTGGGPGTATKVLTYEIYEQQFVFGHYAYAAAISWVLIVVTLALATIYFLILTRRPGRG